MEVDSRNNHIKSLILPTEVVDEQLKCTNCKRLLSIFPIYCISNDGVICGRCQDFLENNAIRNLAYEQLAKNCFFPCTYHSEGCLESGLPSDLLVHEISCQYVTICCPMAKVFRCRWRGTYYELLKHYEYKHPNFILPAPSFHFDVELTNSYVEHVLVPAENDLFILMNRFHPELQTFTSRLKYIGFTSNPQSYTYHLVLENSVRGVSVKYTPNSENVVTIQATKLQQELGFPNAIKATLILVDSSSLTVSPSNVLPTIAPLKEQNEELLKNLECPVCFDVILPPIYQCNAGHSICSQCQPKCQQCPTCRSAVFKTRNYGLEKIVALLEFPCRHKESGCNQQQRYSKLKEHEDNCPFKRANCPLSDIEHCKEQIAKKDIYEHIKSVHHEHLLDLNTITIQLNEEKLEGVNDEQYFIRYDGKVFEMRCTVQDEDWLEWTMTLHDNYGAEDSESYRFEVDIVDGAKLGRRIFLRAGLQQPNVDDDVDDDVYNECILISWRQLKDFVRNDCLTYRVHLIRK